MLNNAEKPNERIRWPDEIEEILQTVPRLIACAKNEFVLGSPKCFMCLQWRLTVWTKLDAIFKYYQAQILQIDDIILLTSTRRNRKCFYSSNLLCSSSVCQISSRN
ncbi:unnamed protein product [Blepharisma stoltei]|uniref:Uncharacterized protein n=1 Tax=Blepharisma stoltei TaxID=1481888 RepID=A0AAU9KG71_9CILI|nr:unnamed protein product [Blepharisma stoltei]